MNEIHGPISDRDAGHPGSAWTLSEASDIIVALLKALKAFRLYLPSHPLLQEFVRELHTRLDGFLAHEAELRLRITQHRIALEGETVYENTAKEQSLAFRLYVHGIREIGFHHGVSPEELSSFLQILHRSFDTQIAADELLANLWEKDLPNVNFIILDDLFDEDENAEFQDFLQSRSSGEAPPPQRPGLPFVADSLPPLNSPAFSPAKRSALADLIRPDPEELAAIEEVVKATLDEDHLAGFEGLVLRILPEPGESQAEEDACALLRAATEEFLRAGSLDAAIRMHRQLRTLAAASNSGSERSSSSRVCLEEDRVLHALRPHLAERPVGNAGMLAEFLADLGPNVAEGLLDFLQDEMTREGAMEVLTHLAPLQPEPLLDRAARSSGPVLRSLLRLLPHTGKPRALGIANEHLRSDQPQVRREALLCIQQIGSPEAAPYVLAALSAAEPELRILAARALAAIPPGPHLEPLLELAKSRRFAKREFLEKKEILLALGRQTDAASEAYLISQASARRWRRSRVDADIRAAAVTALGSRSSTSARKVVESLLGDPSPQVHRAATVALRDSAEPDA
jgi:HEAT repeat protein